MVPIAAVLRTMDNSAKSNQSNDGYDNGIKGINNSNQRSTKASFDKVEQHTQYIYDPAATYYFHGDNGSGGEEKDANSHYDANNLDDPDWTLQQPSSSGEEGNMKDKTSEECNEEVEGEEMEDLSAENEVKDTSWEGDEEKQDTSGEVEVEDKSWEEGDEEVQDSSEDHQAEGNGGGGNAELNNDEVVRGVSKMRKRKCLGDSSLWFDFKNKKQREQEKAYIGWTKFKDQRSKRGALRSKRRMESPCKSRVCQKSRVRQCQKSS